MNSRQQSRNNETGNGEAPKSSKIALVVSAALLSTMFLVAILNSMPTTVLSKTPPTHPVRQEIGRVAPETWAFFTKPPQEAEMGAYSWKHDDEPKSLLHTPQGSARNWFGLSRTQRAQGPELAFLVNQVDWKDCVGQIGECISSASDTGTVQEIKNSSPISTICGDVFLTQEKKIPWAFRDLYPGVQRTVEKVSMVKVNCD